jgi:hypothetical protein
MKKAFDDKFLAKDSKGKFIGLSEDNLALRYSTMGADEKVFAAQYLASKGKLNKVNEQMLDRDLSDKNAKATYDKYGGEKTYEKITKVAGRNDEMIKAKKAIETAEALPAGVAKTDALRNTKKKYEEEKNKFFESFEKKDYNALAKEGFFDLKKLKEGRYNRDAMAAMLLNDPGQFASVTKNIGKGADLDELMKEMGKIRTEVKDGIMEGIKASLKPEDLTKLTSETNKELLEVMKELKASKEDIEVAKTYDNKTILTWIEDRDAKVFKSIGGPSGMTSLEDQMHLLHARNNPEFAKMDEHTDYQKLIRIQESIKKSAARRMNVNVEEERDEKKQEEKKEEKKA